MPGGKCVGMLRPESLDQCINDGLNVVRILRDAGVTILLIEQNMKLAEVVADELHIMVKGRMVYSADPQRFRAEEQLIRTRYLTV